MKRMIKILILVILIILYCKFTAEQMKSPYQFTYSETEKRIVVDSRLWMNRYGGWRGYHTKKELLLFAMLLVGLSCLPRPEKQLDQEEKEPDVEEIKDFDMKRALKNILVKGQPIELPLALSDLGEGFTWKKTDHTALRSDSTGAVTIYFHDEECFHTVAENYYEGAEEQGMIYEIRIKTDDCSIDGFVPGKTTKQEVIERYGKRVKLSEITNIYVYGSKDPDWGPRLAIEFDQNDVVKEIFINT